MEIRQLHIFLQAARTLNFTRAGEITGYSQSSITAHIQQLEKELQTQLFDRLGRSLRLTHAGQILTSYAEEILSLCEKAKTELSSDEVSGALLLGAAESFCVYRLPALLQSYRRHYPQVDLHVETDSCEHFYEQLRAGRLDAALVLTRQIPPPEIAARPLWEESLCFLVGAGHNLARTTLGSWSALERQTFILTSSGCGYRPLILSFLADQGLHPAAQMNLSSVAAIKECAACGLGVAVLPEFSVQQELSSGTLRALPLPVSPPAVYIQLLYHRDKWLHPALHAFIELCQSPLVTGTTYTS